VAGSVGWPTLGDRFMLTFGDGVSNVDIGRLLEFHERHGGWRR
jgi:NDP-sugar pyrophosphorylase family protein